LELGYNHKLPIKTKTKAKNRKKKFRRKNHKKVLKMRMLNEKLKKKESVISRQLEL
jgi:hypothetical protein